MATAERNTKIVQKPVTTMVEEEVPGNGVNLALTDNEAEALISVLRRVGGTPETTRRGFTDRVLHALYSAGYTEVNLAYPGDLEGHLIYREDHINDNQLQELNKDS